MKFRISGAQPRAKYIRVGSSKNPLTAIKTFTEYLPKRLDDKKFLTNFSKIVGQEVDRINDLIHQLLDYGKPMPLTVKSTNVNKLIEETLEALNNNFISCHIKIKKSFQPNAPSLNVDPNQIRQALLNIFMNAMEAMPKGGTLTVETSVSETNYFIIKIKDTGKGIPREHLSQIFDPFFSDKDDGTGLGLSITQSLVENHGGIIQIKSKIGEGTDVRIDLPLYYENKTS